MKKEQYPSEAADRYIVRFPEGMRDEIKHAAEASGRSMNAEIIQRLKSSVEDEDVLKLLLPPETERALFTDAAVNDMEAAERAVQIIQANYGHGGELTSSLSRVEDLAKENAELASLVATMSDREDADFLLYYTKTVQLSQFVKSVLEVKDDLPATLVQTANDLLSLAAAEAAKIQKRHDRIIYFRDLIERSTEREAELDREISENEGDDVDNTHE